MSLKRIRHNNQAISLLIQFVEKRGVSGSFLFYGVNDSILKAFAIEFAKALNCLTISSGCDECTHCLEIQKGIFPDYYLYQARTGVEDLRVLVTNISKSSQVGVKKVILIASAHELTKIEANLLLKIVEEPPTNTFFLFLSQTRHIMPTIVSRCMPIKLTPVNGELIGLEHEQFKTLNYDVRSLYETRLIEEGKVTYQDIPEILENYQESIECNYRLNRAIENYIEEKGSISNFERIEWVFKIEKSLNKNRKLLSFFLTQCIYKIREKSTLEKLLTLKSGVNNNLTIKVLLIRFFDIL